MTDKGRQFTLHFPPSPIFGLLIALRKLQATFFSTKEKNCTGACKRNSLDIATWIYDAGTEAKQKLAALNLSYLADKIARMNY